MKKNTNKEIQAFCENVLAIRKRLKLSKKDMAKSLNIGVGSLCKIEKGIIPPKMSCAVLFKINSNFNICYDDIFEEGAIDKYFGD